uniref:YdaU family protein n=1 Tax=Bartonella vinsonii TaxID=33047 RepID=UPI001F3063AB
MKHANHQETPQYESSRLPYVCWYQNDFLGGVRGMRAHEIGIYTILLNEMYARGRPLELSVERLARLCGCDKRTFVNVLEMLIEEGKILNLANGLWNKRCETIFQERAKLLEQKSFAGHSSAKKRKEINAKVQHLLNERTRDDEQNSKAQKGEEKETPNGVSKKEFFLKEPEEEQTATSLRSPPTSSKPSKKSSPETSHKQALTSLPPTSSETALHGSVLHGPTSDEEAKNDFAKGSSPLPSSHAAPENTAETPAENTAETLPCSNTTTKNASDSSSQAKSHPIISKATSKRANPRGHRLPTDWQADMSAAISEGLSEEQARWQEKKFRDYWHAKSGKDALKVDWQATWRNWFRREIERTKASSTEKFFSTRAINALKPPCAFAHFKPSRKSSTHSREGV